MTTDTADTNRLHALGAELRDFLLQAKRALDEELRAYPTPIPRCDAQFNYAYEQRSRLAELLNRFDAALDPAAGASELQSAMSAFAALPSTGESAEERRLRMRIAEARL